MHLQLRLFLLRTLLLAAAPGALADAWDDASSSASRDAVMLQVEKARIVGDLTKLIQLRAEIKENARDDYAANYDLAYLLWRHGQLLDDDDHDDERQEIFELAHERIERALELRPDDIEARILMSGTLNSLAGESLFARMRLGRRAYNLCLENAERAPKNPRALIQRGLMYHFAPKTFGGDPAAAHATFRAAFDHFDPSEEGPGAWPNWGSVDSAGWLGQALVKEGRIDEARGVYQQALAAYPNARWIREELLPKLEGDVAARD